MSARFRGVLIVLVAALLTLLSANTPDAAQGANRVPPAIRFAPMAEPARTEWIIRQMNDAFARVQPLSAYQTESAAESLAYSRAAPRGSWWLHKRRYGTDYSAFVKFHDDSIRSFLFSGDAAAFVPYVPYNVGGGTSATPTDVLLGAVLPAAPVHWAGPVEDAYDGTIYWAYQKTAGEWWYAVMERMFALTLAVSPTGSGTATPTPDQSAYAKNTEVALAATPGAGWVFSGWSGDLSGSQTPDTLVMSANRSVTATFAPRPFYGLTASSASRYAVSADIGSVLNGVTTFTIEGWMRLGSAAAQRSLVEKNVGNTSALGMRTGESWAGGANDVAVFAKSYNANFGYTTDNWLQTSTWYHVALIYDGGQSTNATKLKLVVNGTQKTLSFDGTIQTTAASNASDLKMTVGSGDTYVAWRVWTAARTVAQVADNRLDPFVDTGTGLAASWEMMPGSGQSVTDIGGGGNILQLGSTAGSDANDPTWTSVYSSIVAAGPQ